MTMLVSGEGVPLELERAGLGSRSVAAVIDVIAQCVALIALIIFDTTVVSASDDAATAALIVVEVVLVLAGYPILFEWLSRGRTLGKLAMGLRVVRDDGGPIGFRHALVRGLSGCLLEKPGLIAPIGTAAGALTMIFNQDNKRLGDLMAGTFVLNERAGSRSSLVAPSLVVADELQGWAAGLDLSGMDDGLALSIRQFVMRAGAFTPQAQYGLGEQLRERLVRVLSPTPSAAIPTPVLLMTVLAERRRRSEQAYHAFASSSPNSQFQPGSDGPTAEQLRPSLDVPPAGYSPSLATHPPAAAASSEPWPTTPPNGFAPPT